MLKINNLSAQVENKTVLSQVDLEVKPGEVHVLLGPNGSGKSSLAQAIMGNPRYQVSQGEIEFDQQNITNLSIEKRVELGLAITFQSPPAIIGLSLESLLDQISQKQVKASKQIQQFMQQLPAVKKLLTRDLNSKFSGGEKKLAELLQVIQLKPKLVIFDELDSGVDLKNLGKITQLIKQEFVAKKIPLLFITHHGQIVDGLQPDWTHLMLDGRISCRSQNYQQVITTIKEYGYQKCRQCQSVDR